MVQAATLPFCITIIFHPHGMLSRYRGFVWTACDKSTFESETRRSTHLQTLTIDDCQADLRLQDLQDRSKSLEGGGVFGLCRLEKTDGVSRCLAPFDDAFDFHEALVEAEFDLDARSHR